jgi:hypothetical protein
VEARTFTARKYPGTLSEVEEGLDTDSHRLPLLREPEAALLTHPAVMEVAVFGIPHRMLGEEVGAVVRVVPDKFGKITQEDLVKHVTPLIAKFKVSAYIKLVNKQLPATPSGKILKVSCFGSSQLLQLLPNTHSTFGSESSEPLLPRRRERSWAASSLPSFNAFLLSFGQ